MKKTRKELCRDVIQKLFFASEYQDVNDDGSIRIVSQSRSVATATNLL